jgi:hypothetical protein
MSNQDPEIAERIQMHADTLYHRMLSHEAAVKEAKEKGIPEPPYQSVFTPESEQSSDFPPDPNNRYDKVPERMLHRIKKPLEKLTPEEQEVEVRALKGEMRVLGAQSEELEDTIIAENIKRVKRRDNMARWVGDWAANWIIP